MTTLPGKSAFPENHPLALGAGGPSTTAMVNKYLHGADTVFGVGASLTKSFFAVPIADNKTFVHLTNDEDAIGRNFAPATRCWATPSWCCGNCWTS